MICPECQHSIAPAAIPAHDTADAQMLSTAGQRRPIPGDPRAWGCPNTVARWFVTLSIQTLCGRPGSHVFVVATCSADVAVAVALARAVLPEAQRRRRGAVLQECTAVVEPWHGIRDLSPVGW
ncbi:hypothetical protein ACH41H_45745 [Streptomyces sp. NPDC020800]|uniref:hypothetical protein n=1 Tax=Streptomyces sp. NPDC020800 TaxID=3365092 RepID=UPI0037B34027